MRKVIDCGLERAGNSALGAVEVGGQRDLRVAERDWRFGGVRVESLDLEMEMETGHERGESSSTVQDGINAGLTAGGVGRVTKARYESVGGKNTEVGWGVVHLYRDGEETAGLGLEMRYPREGEGEEECTTLCIPAVPGYFTASDFLGFVGEKTREMVSHFRMVMTGRMNRYLVLMKFRDAGEARRWRADFDGKVFNGMEVSYASSAYYLKGKEDHADGLIARNLPCHLHQIHHLPNPHHLPPKHQLPRALPRPLHTLLNLNLHLDLPKTLSPTHALPRRTPHLPRMPRTHGRHHRPPHHPLPTRLPLRLSAKMARLRLSRLPAHKSLLNAHPSALRQRRSLSLQRLRLHRRPLDLPHLRPRRLRSL